uniref:Limb development membrane protein 1-like n=1 Tax=Eptatretus burgeri TaxID=7764 RepID=A0A8C4N4C3_EPTBU
FFTLTRNIKVRSNRATNFWLCTFTLAVSLGAVLLLPISIISNEVLLSFPHSYYMQWLNGSLIHGLWNLVFLFSNLSLVFLMPFAYFFMESEGFPGSRKGIVARLYETFVVLFLLALLVLGIVWVALALIDGDAASRQSLSGRLVCCSLLPLTVCTPFGLARMFTITGQLLVKPRLLEDLDDQINTQRMQENVLIRQLNGTLVCKGCTVLFKRKKASPWQRNLGYPLVMLLLLAFTGISVLIVCFHILELLIDETAMPKTAQVCSVCCVLAFHDDLYQPLFIHPQFLICLLLQQLSIFLFQIIYNCVSLLILSSALPILSRTIGITNFDLLGNFGTYNWLGNFYIVLSYNFLFAGLSTLCLVTKFTATVRKELFKALGRFSRMWLLLICENQTWV